MTEISKKQFLDTDLGEILSIWRDILRGFDQPWVLFKYGTCILTNKPFQDESDLKAEAIKLLVRWGQPIAGTPSNKFSVSFLCGQGIPGCLVACHHPSILNYVTPEESSIKGRPEFEGVNLQVGRLGRLKRKYDTEVLEIIHVELPK